MTVATYRAVAPTYGESTALSDLSLPQLRAYRQRLRGEEDRASYWRRLVHARLDLLAADRSTDSSIRLADLIRVLGETGSGVSRQALQRVRASEPLPGLPELSEVWTSPTNAVERAEATSRLQAAEQQLTAYRSALLVRLEESTGVLIRRYQADPAAALSVLS